jgi:hypothetical protein
MADGAEVGVFCARIMVGIDANTIAKMRVRGMKWLLTVVRYVYAGKIHKTSTEL